MNSQISNKIEFQLTKQKFQSKQAALIIKSFDILSWFHKDCKIHVENQDKIKIYQSNGENTCKLSDELLKFQFNVNLKAYLEENKNINPEAGYKQYLQKTQNQKNLMDNILKKINKQKQVPLIYKKIEKKQHFKYRRFNINNKCVPKQQKPGQAIKQFKKNVNQEKKGRFFLIQKSKIYPIQQNLMTTNKVIIKYMLVDASQIKQGQFYNFEVHIIQQQSKLKIVIKDLETFLKKYFGQISRALDIEDYMRKNLALEKKILKQNQFEYSYLQPKQRRSKYIQINLKQGQDENDPKRNQHYALAFQGGGAKGLAYVGVYKALLQTGVPIKSIIGSSAGGIFALAVSTGISPSQLQKICYSMNQIPKKDRIIINSKDIRDKQSKQVFNTIKQLLHLHGIIPNDIFDYIKSFLKPNVVQAIRDLLDSYSGTLGQIIGPFQKGQPFNFYGLLLQGAAMKGQAIQNIASQCLAKYMIRQYAKIVGQKNKLKMVFSSSKWQLINNALQKHIKNYELIKDLKLFKLLDQINNADWSKQQKNICIKSLIITIINKCLLYLSELENQLEYNQVHTEYQINKLKFGQLFKLFSLVQRNSENVNSLSQQIIQDKLKQQQNEVQQKKVQKKKVQQKNDQQKKVQQINSKQKLSQQTIAVTQQLIPIQMENMKQSIKTFRDFETFFGQSFTIDPDLFQVKENNQAQIAQFTLESFFSGISEIFNNTNDKKRHWYQIADIISETIQYFEDEKYQQIVKKYIDKKQPKKSFISKAWSLVTFQSFRKKQEIKVQKPSKQDIDVQIIAQKINDYQHLKDFMKTITLAQYYQLNQIQLTSTSVDLDHDTMRFFNHKTTPDLPVCKSVQMTGSFPVGFLAQKWKSEWGNYYVHYDGLRRQIDLTGNQFTDGGMLANFPIKYLDNPIMRSKYFSHHPTVEDSKIIGFGLDYLTSEGYYQSSLEMAADLNKQHKSSYALQKLIKQFKKQVGFIQIIKGSWKYSRSDSPNDVTVNEQFIEKICQMIKKIPLLKFIIKIAKAYPNADRYLNLQCFSQHIIYEDLQALEHLYLPDKQNSKQLQKQKQKQQQKQKQRVQLITKINIFIDSLNKNERPDIRETFFRTLPQKNDLQITRNLNSQQQPNLKNILLHQNLQNNPQNSISMIFNQQNFIREKYRGLQIYFNTPMNQSDDIQVKGQLQRKIKSHTVSIVKLDKETKEEKQKRDKQTQQKQKQITRKKDDSINKLKVKLLITIMQTMIQKMKYQLSQNEINDYTTQYLFKYAVLSSKQIKDYQKYPTLNNISIKEKLYQLAICKFQKMLKNKQFNQIQKLASFENFKKQYNQNLFKQNQNSQTKRLNKAQENAIDQILSETQKRIIKFSKQLLQQFIDVRGQHINKNLNNFTLFILSQVEQNKVKERFKQIYEMNPNNVLLISDYISVQKLLSIWNNIFKTQLLSQEQIIKNYYRWHFSQKIFGQIKTNTQKVFNTLISILTNDIKLIKNKTDKFILTIAANLNLFSNQQQLDIKQTVCKYVMGSYKNTILGNMEDNLMCKLVQKWNNQDYNKYLVEKNMQVINIFEMNRVCDLIKELMKSEEINKKDKNKLVKSVLQDNTTPFFYQVYKGIQQKNNKHKKQKQSLTKILDIYYQNCAKQICEYFQAKKTLSEKKILPGKPLEQPGKDIEFSIEAIQKVQQENIVKIIITNEQKTLKDKLNVNQNILIKQWINQELKKDNSLLKINCYLVTYNCYMFTFKRTKLQIFINQLFSNIKRERQLKITELAKIEKNDQGLQQSQKTQKKERCQHQKDLSQAKIYKFKKCHQDYMFFNILINHMCYRLSKLLESDPFTNLSKMINLWRLALNKIDNPGNKKSNKNEFLQYKKIIVDTCQKYYALINNICSVQYKGSDLFKDFEKNIKQLEQFQRIIFIQQSIDISSQIQKLQSIISKLKTFFDLNQKHYYSKIQFLSAHLQALQKNIHLADKLLQNLNLQSEKKLTEIIKNKDSIIYVSDIQELFLVNSDFFQGLSYLQQNLFNVDKQFFGKLKDRIFSIPLICIDRKQLQAERKFEISKRIFAILNNQLQKASASQSDKCNLYHLHLVMEGVGKSNLYYSSYFKMIEQNLSKFSSWKHAGKQNLKIHIKISAITCANFHSVFGFLYAIGHSDEQIRKQMNNIQSIAQVLENNIDQNFNQYKWTSCSQMQMKQCFNQVWNDQYNVFNDLQKAYISEVDILKNIQQVKEMYISDKKKILSYCENSFQDLIQLIGKKIDKKTYQKRKVQICKTLGINYICEYNKCHPYGDQNKDSSKSVISLISSMFNQYESLIQYIITSNDLILKNFQITEGNKTYLWKGIITKKLFTTYKLKKYICDHLKELKMNPNITLGEFYQQANKKVLLTFTTIDNAQKRVQFMNKNSLPNIPIWAAILATSSLNYLYRQFQGRKQWTRKQFIGTSLFSKVVEDFFQKQEKMRSISNYSSGNIISTLPLQLLTNITVRKQMFTLKEKEENEKEPDIRFIYLALAFKTPRIKPQAYPKKLVRNYLDGAFTKVLKYMIKMPSVVSNIMNNVCTLQGHKNSTYINKESTYIKQKILKMASFGDTGKSFSLFVQSNDNLIMSLYKNKVIKCPIKIGTLDFHQITKKKGSKKLDFPSEKALETIQRSYYITKNFISDQNINLENQNSGTIRRKAFIRIQFFSESNQKNQIQSQKQNRKCRLSFLSQSKWNKTLQKQFIVEYSLWEQNFQKLPFQKVQNQQIVWDTVCNNKIYLKFYYPYTQGKINGKGKKFIVENRLCISVQNLLKQFKYNYNLVSGSNVVSFDYVLDYSQIKNGGKLFAMKMNRLTIRQTNNIFINENYNKSWIYVIQAFNATYKKNKIPEFSYQFTKLNNRNRNSLDWAAKINAYSHIDKINLDKEVVLDCTFCKQHLTLINNGRSKKKCQLCSEVYGKLECKNKNINAEALCTNPSFCLNCAHQYIIKRKQAQLLCLLCSTIKLDINGQDTVKDMREYKINIEARGQKQCFFCYQLYSANVLYSCQKCNTQVCERCVNKLC